MIASSSRAGFLRAAAWLAVLAVLAYGPWVSRLGFYRDDWYVLWAGHAFGATSIITMFSIDRPFVGQLFSLAYSLFGESAIAWQVYALFLRWLGAVFALGLFRSLWPSRPTATTLAAVLFLIYPGFLQQPNAMTFTNQLTTYALALASLALTAWAVGAPRRGARTALTVLALATSLAYQLLYEYMIGLEAARVAILILFAWRDRSTDARRRRKWVVGSWAPYGAVIAGNLAWRLVFFHSQRGATDLPGLLLSYAANPVRTLGVQLIELAKDVPEVLVGGWVVPLYRYANGLDYGSLAVGLGLAAAGVAGCLLALGWMRRGEPPAVEATPNPQLEILLVGATALVGSLLPVIFASRDVRWESGFDRYSLHATLGMALLTVGLGLSIQARALRRTLILSLVAAGLLTHYLNGASWAAFWDAQRQLWWQLSWRAPQFEPDTVLLAQLPAEGFYEDYEVWGAANRIYQPGPGPLRIVSEVFDEATAEKVRLGVSDSRGMREIIRFHRDFSNVVVAARPSAASCVHLLDGRRPEYPVDSSSLVRAVGRFSDINRVQAAASPAPVPELFGPEPAHGWCYYYQKVSLARQKGDWSEAAELSAQAVSLGLEPSDRSEWMPFLESFAKAGDEEAASRIAEKIQDREAVRHDLCDQMRGEPAPGFTQEEYRDVLDLMCEFR